MSWVSPTGFSDPSTVWSWEPQAYDENTATSAQCNVIKQTWSGWLILTHAAVNSDKVQWWIDAGMHADINRVQVKVKKDGVEVLIFDGVPVKGVWVEQGFAQGDVTEIHFRFWNNGVFINWAAFVNESDFWELPSGLKKVVRLNFPLCVTLEDMNVAKGDKVLKVNEGIGVVLVAKNALKGEIVLVL